MAINSVVERAAAENKSVQELLKELFERYHTQAAVARELGVTQSTISLWLLRAGLQQHTILVPRRFEAVTE